MQARLHLRMRTGTPACCPACCPASMHWHTEVLACIPIRFASGRGLNARALHCLHKELDKFYGGLGCSRTPRTPSRPVQASINPHGLRKEGGTLVGFTETTPAAMASPPPDEDTPPTSLLSLPEHFMGELYRLLPDRQARCAFAHCCKEVHDAPSAGV